MILDSLECCLLGGAGGLVLEGGRDALGQVGEFREWYFPVEFLGGVFSFCLGGCL